MAIQVHDLFDTWKAASAVFLAGLITFTSSWSSPTAGALLVLWAGYSLTWLIKSYTFPDDTWRKPASAVDCIAFSVVLGIYYSGAVLTIVKHREAPAPVITASLFAHLMGIFLLYVTDMQRYTHLQLKPDDLITTGMFKYVRNANYVGEALIYTGFVGIPTATLHTGLLFLYHALIVGALWVPEMLKKDKKLAHIKSGDWQSYKKSSWLFIPPFF